MKETKFQTFNFELNKSGNDELAPTIITYARYEYLGRYVFMIKGELIEREKSDFIMLNGVQIKKQVQNMKMVISDSQNNCSITISLSNIFECTELDSEYSYLEDFIDMLNHVLNTGYDSDTKYFGDEIRKVFKQLIYYSLIAYIHHNEDIKVGEKEELIYLEALNGATL